METYQEKLSRPEWQDRRKQILSRDRFQCQECRSGEDLNVHHRYYAKGAEPWEYPDEALVTLCKSCHSKTEDMLYKLRKIAGEMSIVQMKLLLSLAFGIKILELSQRQLDCIVAGAKPEAMTGMMREVLYGTTRQVMESILESR